jgi:amino acid transporter
VRPRRGCNIYGVTFILIGNASANALSFASNVLAAADYTGNTQNAVRAIAIGTMTGVCLMHGIWRRLGIVVNNIFALFKLLMMLMIIIVGFMSIGGKVFGTEPTMKTNLDPKNSFVDAQDQPYGVSRCGVCVWRF